MKQCWHEKNYSKLGILLNRIQLGLLDRVQESKVKDKIDL